MADAPKIPVDSCAKVAELHEKLKEAINKKLEEKDWTKYEKEEFKRALLKAYEETVELALRENVIVKQEDRSSADVVQQEMEPVNIDRAMEVNKMCAESEDLLTQTIKKRKFYPKKIKECLQKQHNTEMNYLCDLDEKELLKSRVQVDSLQGSSALNERQIDMNGCEAYSKELKTASENLLLLSKSLPEIRDKVKRLRTVTEAHLRMQGSEIGMELYGKRKMPTTFDSILATPTKDNADDTFPEPEMTVTTTSGWVGQHFPSKKVKGLQRQDFHDST